MEFHSHDSRFTKCANPGCPIQSDPEIFVELADRKVMRFCSDNCCQEWGALVKRYAARARDEA